MLPRRQPRSGLRHTWAEIGGADVLTARFAESHGGVPPQRNVGASVTKLPRVRNEISSVSLKRSFALQPQAPGLGRGKSSAAVEAVGKMPITLSTFVSLRLDSIMPLHPARRSMPPAFFSLE